MFHPLVVIEIQSKPDEERCELQMQVYLLLLMNTRGLRRVFGILVYNDGRCRAYKASRDVGNNCVYEQDEIFYVCHIARVIADLLGRG